MKIPYGKQYIDHKDRKSVMNALSKELITTGPFVLKFEKKLEKYFNCNFAHVCSSGTSAIHLAMLSIGFMKGDVILMPAINFIASYNMAKSLGAKIYLVDVDEYTGQITKKKILECIKKNKLKKIKALITMHHGGYPNDLISFYKLKKKYKFYIIEDACHALGAEYKFRKNKIKVGSCKHSDICTFSLHPVKTITSGEGGIVTTNNIKISNKIKLYRNHGIMRDPKHYWKYDVIKNGYNYRLSDLNCALGLSQLKKINSFVKARENVFKNYFDQLSNFNSKILIPNYSKDIKPSFHLFIINIHFAKMNSNKDHFIKYLNKNNIFPQFHYIPIYKFTAYKGSKKKLNGSEKYFNNSISLPIFFGLDKKNQKKVIDIIKKYFK